MIPKDLLDDALSSMPKLVSADEDVKKAVAEGMSVAQAFAKFRG